MSEALVEPGLEPAADPGAGVEPTPVSGAAPAVEPAAPTPEPAPAPINWDDINLLNEAAARIAALGYEIKPTEPAAPQAEPEWDPFNPQTVDARLQAQMTPLEQRLAALEGALQAQAKAEADALVNSRVELAVDAAGLAPAEGQTAEQMNAAVVAVANNFAAAKLAALGRQPYGAEAQKIGDDSIAEAVAFFHSLRATGATQGAEQYREQLAKDSHLLDPGVRGAGVEGAPAPVSELDVARRFVDAQRGR